MFDVSLPPVAPASPTGNPLTKIGDAVRELASVGRSLNFATFTVHATKPMHYSASLSLRFEQTSTP